ncbi:hypothetical protein HZS_2592 [Henneguya salminicola]|nr:hypothetical protein HZS_2592 [Henneguya salminicola]
MNPDSIFTNRLTMDTQTRTLMLYRLCDRTEEEMFQHVAVLIREHSQVSRLWLWIMFAFTNPGKF